MPNHFWLKSNVGRNYYVDPDDALQTKDALHNLGYYSAPAHYGMTPYPDEQMFTGIEQFQDDFDLSRDGMMRPNGETVLKLNEVLERRDYGFEVAQRSPDVDRTAGSTESIEQEAAVQAIPFIIYEIATYTGMAISAAYAWWLSLSVEEKKKIRDQIDAIAQQGPSDDEIEDACDEMHYKIDIPTCRQIAKKRGKTAGAKCYASANERYAACRAGRPIPPLDTWSN